MEEKKQVWSTADIIKNRNNWTLASDVELLKHMQSLSEKLVSKSRSTLQLLNAFEDDVNSACTSVANVNNRFEALSDTQFIENKVRDDSPESEGPSVEVQQKGEESCENITGKLNEALSNGIKVLRTEYDIIAVTDSESEDDEPQEVLLKARNPFMSRRLPYVIGSEEFNKHDHLGLVTSSEDEDDENDSEEDEDEEEDEKDDLPYLKKVIVPPPEIVNIGPSSRTQVIQVSSDSENSDISSSESEKHEEKVAQNHAHSRPAQNTPKASHTFADHLNATLQSMSSNMVTPLVDDLFSPPPLPTNEDDRSSVDEESDNGSDIFARPIKVAEPRAKPNIVTDIFDDDVSRNVESPRISPKSSPTADKKRSSGDSSTLKSAHTAVNNEPHLPPKPRVNAPTAKMFSALNAELSNKFNKKVVAKDEPVSSDDSEPPPIKDREKRIVAQKPEKSSESRNDSKISREAPTPSVRTSNLPAGDILEKTSSKSKPNKSGSALKSPVDDVFAGSSSNSHQSSVTPKPKTSQVKPKVGTLFDDDDSMDELFGSNSKDKKKSVPPSVTVGGPRKNLFGDSDDLFSPTKEAEKFTGSTSSLSSKKIGLFDDDSDSGDDIFAIINSQKKKSTPSVAKPDVEKKSQSSADNLFGNKKTAPVGSETNLFAESKSTSNSSVKTDLFETKNTADERSRRGTNLFDIDNESDDIFSVSAKSEKVVSSSERENFGNDLFGSKTEKKTVEIKQEKPMSKDSFESVVSKKESLFDEEKEEFVDRDTLRKTPSKPSIVPRSTFSENLNKKLSGSLFDTEKEIVYDSEENKSASQDVSSKMTNPPVTIPRSKFVENPDKMKSDVSASSVESDISVGAPLESAPDQSTKQTAFSKKAAKPSVLPRSKFIEKTELFASSVLENQATSDSAESLHPSRGAVSALSRQFKETPAPSIPKRTPDAADGSDDPTIDKIDGNQASITKPPAKLALSRGLNINVNALLPGSSWSSISKQVKETVAETPDSEERITPDNPTETPSTILAEPLKSVEKCPSSLTAMAKERTKIAGRRRPPSRRARVNKALQSDVFASNSHAGSDDNEPDSAYKTASESNSPEKKSTVEKTDIKNTEQKKDSLPSLEETQFVPPTSAMINYQKERSKLAKLVKKRPPSVPKEKTVNDLPAGETENKNKTADDLGNILITASHSREPPAMMGNDFKSVLSDSDKDDDDDDDDPFNDLLTESESIRDPIPQIDAESNVVFPSSRSSPPPAAPKTSTVDKPTLFDSSEDDQSDDLFATLKSPISPPPAASDATKRAEPVISSSNIINQPSKNPITVDKPPALEKNALTSNIQFANESNANATLKSGTKLTSDLFSFNEDDSSDEDDLDALLSKVMPPKASATKSQETTSTMLSASNEPVFDLNKGSSASNTVQEATISKAPEKSDLFAEIDAPPEIKTSTESRTTRSEVSSLFTPSNKEAKESSNVSKETTIRELSQKSDPFAKSDSLPEIKSSTESRKTRNDDDSLFTHSNKGAKKSSKTTTNLFAVDDDDDELFSSSRSSVKTKISTSKSLFADEDEDDDSSLFGSGAVSSHRGDKSIETSRSSKATAPTEKARIVKLRSETVEKDPLTGKTVRK